MYLQAGRGIEMCIRDRYGGCENGQFQVGQMTYDAILVPGCVTLRRSTLEYLADFQKAGGRLIFMGEPARLVDAVPSEEAAALARNCQNIRFSQTELLDALEDVRTVDIRMEDGSRANRYLYQMRNTDEGKWLFIAQGLPAENPDIPHVHTLSIRMPGCYYVELYDTSVSYTHLDVYKRQELRTTYTQQRDRRLENLSSAYKMYCEGRRRTTDCTLHCASKARLRGVAYNLYAAARCV